VPRNRHALADPDSHHARHTHGMASHSHTLPLLRLYSSRLSPSRSVAQCTRLSTKARRYALPIHPMYTMFTQWSHPVSEHSLLRQSRRITQQFLDIVFPPQCAGCQSSGTVLCATCRATFRAANLQFCRQCGRPLPITGLCQNCRPYQPTLSGLLAVSSYQGALRSCIHALKYNGNTRLAEPLGEVLAETYLAFGMQADVIISVPLHAERQ